MDNSIATVNGEFFNRLENLLLTQNQTILGKVGEVSKDVETLKSTVDNMKCDIEDIKYNEEITYEQQATIDREVSKTVYKLLGIGNDPAKWTTEERVINKKYGRLFRRRCRLEVTNKGNLAFPYRTTKKGNFIGACKDIEAWVPRNGIESLKKEADDNALANRIAREQGYKP